MHRNYAVIKNAPMDAELGVKTRSIIDLIDSVPSFYGSREGGGKGAAPSTLSRLGDSKLGGGAGWGELCLAEDGVCGGRGLCVTCFLFYPHLVEPRRPKTRSHNVQQPINPLWLGGGTCVCVLVLLASPMLSIPHLVELT